jgi:hypothetical protein
MFKGLDLGLGTIVSSVHGEKRCKTVCWEMLGLESNNMVVFRSLTLRLLYFKNGISSFFGDETSKKCNFRTFDPIAVP